MRKKSRRANPFRVIILLVIIGALIYFNQLVIPTMPTLFQATPTATRPPEAYVTEAEALEKEGKYSLAINSYAEAVQVDPRNPNNHVALARLNIYTPGIMQKLSPMRRMHCCSTQITLRLWLFGHGQLV